MIFNDNCHKLQNDIHQKLRNIILTSVSQDSVYRIFNLDFRMESIIMSFDEACVGIFVSITIIRLQKFLKLLLIFLFIVFVVSQYKGLESTIVFFPA